MQYAKITLTIAVEDYGLQDVNPLDYVLPSLDEVSEVIVLEYDSSPMILRPDHRAHAEKASQ